MRVGNVVDTVAGPAYVFYRIIETGESQKIWPTSPAYGLIQKKTFSLRKSTGKLSYKKLQANCLTIKVHANHKQITIKHHLPRHERGLAFTWDRMD